MATVDLIDHNPDSNCVACCANSERINTLVIKLESLVEAITPEQIEKVSPMIRLMSKLGGIGG